MTRKIDIAAGPSGIPRSQRWALVLCVAAGFPLGIGILALTWWSAWSWAGTLLMAFSPMVAVQLYMRLFRAADMRPAMARYSRRLSVTMVVYFVALWGGLMLYERGLTRGALGYVVAVAAAAPIVNVFIVVARLLREERDELARRIMLEALVWSGGLTLCEATVWGFLETFGKVPNVWMWAVPAAFFAQLGISAPLVVRKYR